MKGDARAQRLFVGMIDTAQREKRTERRALFEAAAGYKTDWDEEIAEADRAGRPRPDPVPHPDDIHLDLATGSGHLPRGHDP